jgi:hypothetical protein
MPWAVGGGPCWVLGVVGGVVGGRLGAPVAGGLLRWYVCVVGAGGLGGMRRNTTNKGAV